MSTLEVVEEEVEVEGGEGEERGVLKGDEVVEGEEGGGEKVQHDEIGEDGAGLMLSAYHACSVGRALMGGSGALHALGEEESGRFVEAVLSEGRGWFATDLPASEGGGLVEVHPEGTATSFLWAGHGVGDRSIARALLSSLLSTTPLASPSASSSPTKTHISNPSLLSRPLPPVLVSKSPLHGVTGILANMERLVVALHKHLSPLGQGPFHVIPTSFVVRREEVQKKGVEGSKGFEVWESFAAALAKGNAPPHGSGLGLKQCLAGLWAVKPLTQPTHNIAVVSSKRRVANAIASIAKQGDETDEKVAEKEGGGEKEKEKEKEKEGEVEDDVLIQKYLERPLLLRGRKFDIRLFVLVLERFGGVEGWVFEEGYVRTAGRKFGFVATKGRGVTHDAVHNTSSLAQQPSRYFGAFEPNNVLTFDETEDLLAFSSDPPPPPNVLRSVILPAAKQSITDAILAATKQAALESTQIAANVGQKFAGEAGKAAVMARAPKARSGSWLPLLASALESQSSPTPTKSSPKSSTPLHSSTTESSPQFSVESQTLLGGSLLDGAGRGVASFGIMEAGIVVDEDYRPWLLSFAPLHPPGLEHDEEGREVKEGEEEIGGPSSTAQPHVPLPATSTRWLCSSDERVEGLVGAAWRDALELVVDRVLPPVVGMDGVKEVIGEEGGEYEVGSMLELGVSEGNGWMSVVNEWDEEWEEEVVRLGSEGNGGCRKVFESRLRGGIARNAMRQRRPTSVAHFSSTSSSSTSPFSTPTRRHSLTPSLTTSSSTSSPSTSASIDPSLLFASSTFLPSTSSATSTSTPHQPATTTSHTLQSLFVQREEEGEEEELPEEGEEEEEEDSEEEEEEDIGMKAGGGEERGEVGMRRVVRVKKAVSSSSSSKTTTTTPASLYPTPTPTTSSISITPLPPPNPSSLTRSPRRIVRVTPKKKKEEEKVVEDKEGVEGGKEAVVEDEEEVEEDKKEVEGDKEEVVQDREEVVQDRATDKEEVVKEVEDDAGVAMEKEKGVVVEQEGEGQLDVEGKQEEKRKEEEKEEKRIEQEREKEDVKEEVTKVAKEGTESLKKPIGTTVDATPHSPPPPPHRTPPLSSPPPPPQKVSSGEKEKIEEEEARAKEVKEKEEREKEKREKEEREKEEREKREEDEKRRKWEEEKEKEKRREEEEERERRRRMEEEERRKQLEEEELIKRRKREEILQSYNLVSAPLPPSYDVFSPSVDKKVGKRDELVEEGESGVDMGDFDPFQPKKEEKIRGGGIGGDRKPREFKFSTFTSPQPPITRSPPSPPWSLRPSGIFFATEISRRREKELDEDGSGEMDGEGEGAAEDVDNFPSFPPPPPPTATTTTTSTYDHTSSHTAPPTPSTPPSAPPLTFWADRVIHNVRPVLTVLDEAGSVKKKEEKKEGGGTYEYLPYTATRTAKSTPLISTTTKPSTTSRKPSPLTTTTLPPSSKASPPSPTTMWNTWQSQVLQTSSPQPPHPTPPQHPTVSTKPPQPPPSPSRLRANGAMEILDPNPKPKTPTPTTPPSPSHPHPITSSIPLHSIMHHPTPTIPQESTSTFLPPSSSSSSKPKHPKPSSSLFLPSPHILDRIEKIPIPPPTSSETKRPPSPTSALPPPPRLNSVAPHTSIDDAMDNLTETIVREATT